jgi:hypothetical protein
VIDHARERVSATRASHDHGAVDGRDRARLGLMIGQRQH